MIIPKRFGSDPVPVGDPSREAIEYAPTTALKPLEVVNVGNSNTDIAEVPDGEYWEALALSAYNRDNTSSANLTLYLVESGESAGSSTEVFRTGSIASIASQQVAPLINVSMNPGAKIIGISDSAIGFNVYGSFRRHFRGSRRD